MIGVGGIGGYLGSFLNESKFDVTFIARKKVLIFKIKGLILESQNKKKKQKIKVLEEIPDQ